MLFNAHRFRTRLEDTVVLQTNAVETATMTSARWILLLVTNHYFGHGNMIANNG